VEQVAAVLETAAVSPSAPKVITVMTKENLDETVITLGVSSVTGTAAVENFVDDESRGTASQVLPTVITPKPTVITVITPEPTVITEEDLEEQPESKAIDFLNTPLEIRTIAKALREMRGLILTEMNNLAKGNGKKETVEARLEQRKGEFLALYEPNEAALEVHYQGLVEQKKRLFQY
jgi:hypothetical protein